MADRGYFKDVADRLFFTPSDEVLDICCRYAQSIEEDVEYVRSLDMDDSPIHYLSHHIEIDSEVPMSPCHVENVHLLKSLISNYAIPNRKKDR